MKSALVSATAAMSLFLVVNYANAQVPVGRGGGYYQTAPPPYRHYYYQTTFPPIQNQSSNHLTYAQPRSVQPQQRQLRWWELHVHYPDSAAVDSKSSWYQKPWSETAPE